MIKVTLATLLLLGPVLAYAQDRVLYPEDLTPPRSDYPRDPGSQPVPQNPRQPIPSPKDRQDRDQNLITNLVNAVNIYARAHALDEGEADARREARKFLKEHSGRAGALYNVEVMERAPTGSAGDAAQVFYASRVSLVGSGTMGQAIDEAADSYGRGTVRQDVPGTVVHSAYVYVERDGTDTQPTTHELDYFSRLNAAQAEQMARARRDNAAFEKRQAELKEAEAAARRKDDDRREAALRAKAEEERREHEEEARRQQQREKDAERIAELRDHGPSMSREHLRDAQDALERAEKQKNIARPIDRDDGPIPKTSMCPQCRVAFKERAVWSTEQYRDELREKLDRGVPTLVSPAAAKPTVDIPQPTVKIPGTEKVIRGAPSRNRSKKS